MDESNKITNLFIECNYKISFQFYTSAATGQYLTKRIYFAMDCNSDIHFPAREIFSKFFKAIVEKLGKNMILKHYLKFANFYELLIFYHLFL